MWAASQGHQSIVKLLLESGADVNAKNKYGGTVLNAAHESYSSDVIRMVEDAGGK